MPILNVIAGVFIGWTNDWSGVFVVPFVWGFVWWVSQWVLGSLDRYKAAWNPKPGWKLGPRTTFFVQQYAIAVLTSLPVAVATAGIKTLFS